MNNNKPTNATEKVALSIAPNGDMIKENKYEVSTPMKLNIPPVKPAANKIFIDPIPIKESQTKSGLYLTGDKEARGIVVAVPDDSKFTVGDIVLLEPLEYPLYMVEGYAYMVIYESTIIATYSNVKMTADGPVSIGY